MVHFMRCIRVFVSFSSCCSMTNTESMAQLIRNRSKRLYCRYYLSCHEERAVNRSIAHWPRWQLVWDQKGGGVQQVQSKPRKTSDAV
uniref:Putative secreted protein n=1 Tax=Anopheles triannulatus TaxID=58253 RepID=A0A2M4B0Y9_9DIPT